MKLVVVLLSLLIARSAPAIDVRIHPDDGDYVLHAKAGPSIEGRADTMAMGLVSDLDWKQVLACLPAAPGQTLSFRFSRPLEAVRVRSFASPGCTGIASAPSRNRAIPMLEVPTSGRRIGIWDGDTSSRSRLSVTLVDPAIEPSPALSVDDPRCGAGNGGTITVFSETTDEFFTQELPCLNWNLLGREDDPVGYRYRDPVRRFGPCHSVVLRGDRLTVKCRASDDAPLAYDLSAAIPQPPVSVEIRVGGTIHCAEYGGSLRADGSNGAEFVASDAPAPAACR